MQIPAAMDSSAHVDDTSLDPDLATLFAALERKLGGGSRRLTLRAWREGAESWRILEALRQARGNRSAAARSLGIGRRTLYTKMEKLGIQPSWSAAASAVPLEPALGNGAGALARPAGSS